MGLLRVVSKARSISRRFLEPLESQLCISHCISIFLRFLVISDSRFHSYFPAILLISAMLNLCLPLFVPIFLVNNVFLRTWGSESSFSLCKWLFGSIWVAYTIFRHPYIYIYISSYLSYFHPFSQLQVGKSHVPRSSRRFATILATAAGSGPAGVHAQSVQYNAQLGGAFGMGENLEVAPRTKWACLNIWYL